MLRLGRLRQRPGGTLSDLIGKLLHSQPRDDQRAGKDYHDGGAKQKLALGRK
jgi:hypothetical protein